MTPPYVTFNIIENYTRYTICFNNLKQNKVEYVLLTFTVEVVERWKAECQVQICHLSQQDDCHVACCGTHDFGS